MALIVPKFDDLAGAIDTPLGLRCLACGWCFTNGRCRRCATLGTPIDTAADPGSTDPAAPVSGERLAPSTASSAGETTSESTLEPAASTGSAGDEASDRPIIGSLSIEGKNGGRLRFGGTNRGGPGRPRSVVRQAALKSYDERIPALEAIADREAVDYVPTKAGVVAVPPKLDTVIRAMAELRACAGMGHLPEDPPAKTRPRQITVVYRDELGS